MYIYGGYSKEKSPGQKSEGRTHEDMWMLSLRQVVAAAGGALDSRKASWQKIGRKGNPPSTRCGAVMTLYKNKGLLFGGVFDQEGARHSLVSTFYNDMFAFDSERRRWYQLGLKTPKAFREKKHKKLRSLTPREGDDYGDCVEEEEDEDEESSSDDSTAEDERGDSSNPDPSPAAESSNKFGFINDEGQVVYVDLDEDDSEELRVWELSLGEASQAQAQKGDPLTDGCLGIDDSIAVLEEELTHPVVSPIVHAAESLPSTPVVMESLRREAVSSAYKAAFEMKLSEETATSVYGSYFASLTMPCPRINPAVLVRSKVYVNFKYVMG